MTNALISAVQSMQNDLQYMDTISQNMVNMATTGYKRSIPVTASFSNAMNIAGSAATVSSADSGARTMPSVAFAGAMPSLTSTLDLSVGPVKQTGRPWDLAITGDGYFEFATPDGPAYSRAGDFHADSTGRLVSATGLAVQGRGGDILLNGNSAVIDPSGNVVQEGVTVGQIKVVQFRKGETLLKTPAGLLRPGGTTSGAETPPHLQVGFLESSNVTPLREMISMMETTRHFEAAQKLFQGYDELLRTAIQKLGEF